jgi:cytochrome oxidase assembly protein ShyY1
VLLDNRPHGNGTDSRGFLVLTPLRLADGGSVLVMRGWLPRDAQDRTRIAPFDTPPASHCRRHRAGRCAARLASGRMLPRRPAARSVRISTLPLFP